ncbi:MAG: SEL1-like repeat protein [Lentisphaeria bacterium]|nr:SEL1-like repeat protein [Lentisphaeria bacterium]
MKEMSEEMVRNARELLEKGEIETAEKQLVEAAEAGNAEAKRILAEEYRHGFHLHCNSHQDLRYAREAALAGSMADRCIMAILAATGMEKKVKRNRQDAENWLKPIQQEPIADAICKLFGLLGRAADRAAAAEYFLNDPENDPAQIDDPNRLYIAFMAIIVLLQNCPKTDVDLQLYLWSELFSRGRRLAELNSLAGHSSLGLVLDSFPGFDPEQEKELVDLLEQAAAREDYESMLYLGRYLMKHGQKERGEKLIRTAAEHEVWAAVTEAALMDLNNGADPEKILPLLERSIEEDDDGTALVPAAKLCRDFDEAKALEYIRKAVEQGDPEGMLLLGQAYMEGRALDKNPELAVRYFREAAENGNAEAHLRLGQAMQSGEGTERDPYAALGHILYCPHATGDPEALLIAGRALISGTGCIADRKEGMELIRLAMEQDYAPAVFDWCMESMEDSDEPLSSEQIKDLVLKIEKAAEKGFPPAQTVCGLNLLNGFGCELDAGKAAEWFKRASANGDPDAAYWLGFMSLHGIGLKADEEAARNYFASAAENNGNPAAMYELGKLCLKEKNYIRAWQNFASASEKEHAEATLELAGMYEKGLGMPADPETAARLREKAEAEKAEAEKQ